MTSNSQQYYKDYYLKNKEKIDKRALDYARTHPEENRARANEWYRKNKLRARSNVKVWQNNNRRKLKGYKRWLRYHLSVEEYDLMLRLQDDKCALCKESFGYRGPHIDHDHNTGRIRGLLCISCNALLGFAKDSPERLTRAIEYLVRSKNGP